MPKRYFYTLLMLFVFIGSVSAMSFPRRYVYVPIDSLSEMHISTYVLLDLKSDTINISINGKASFLYCSPNTDPLFRNNYIIRDKDSTLNVQINKILSFTADSVFLSARHNYQNYGTIIMPRTQLKGVSYIEGRPNKAYTSFYGGIGVNIKEVRKEGEIDSKNYYIAEIGFAYSKFNGAGYSIYGGSEFLFNKDKFLVGPKIGANVSMLLATIGNEIICYTDFKQQTLCSKPYFAIGFNAFKCSVGFNIHFYNKKQFNMNTPTLSITLPFGMKDK